MAYTYDDFQRKLQASGMGSQFSQADLALAQQNPDAGMSILSYKQDYANAKTDAARAMANAGANSVRSSYGNYSGGVTGGSYQMGPLSPSSFSYGSAPTYSNPYAADIQALYQKQINYAPYQDNLVKPVYNNRYDGQIQELLDQILNRDPFSYDASTDPLYSQYKKEYTREGRRAQQEALAQAAAMSGGLPSSYAQTAAGQAGDYYMSKLTDKIPELYQLAYQKYMNEYGMKQSDLAAVQGQEQMDYSKYLSDLSQYNTDRNFDYGKWLDGYNMAAQNLQAASGLDQVEFGKYQTALNQFNNDRSFSYGQLVDEVNAQAARRAEQLEMAQLAGKYGDYSKLNALGIDTSAMLKPAGGSGGSGSGKSNKEATYGSGLSGTAYSQVYTAMQKSLGGGNFTRAENMLDEFSGSLNKDQTLNIQNLMEKYGYKF